MAADDDSNTEQSQQHSSLIVEEVRTDVGGVLRVTDPKTGRSGYVSKTPSIMFDLPEAV